LQEPKLEQDSTSGQHGELPTYNAYSIDGDVVAEVVYVNYGLPSDYEELERRGISLEGKIAMARYGGAWRGIKPRLAASHGAIGAIIYSDPADDGFAKGDVYPEGAYRPEYSVQRGSVMDQAPNTGDPLTPFRAATKSAKRKKLEDVEVLSPIPVLPISYRDAQPILKALGGQVVPESWRGALGQTYHFGPGPAKIHLNVEFNWDIAPLYNVLARMQGTDYPDQWIIRGNHHDAWVYGAVDPVSGVISVMEEARIIGELAKVGKRPRRTLVFAAWDGEEQGLVGSTEWVEKHAQELREKAVAYINTDLIARGFLYIAGSHSLEKFINQISRDVIDPQTGVSVDQRFRAWASLNGPPSMREEIISRSDRRIEAAGSGSDFTPFLQHLGISSLNMAYIGEGRGGEYHSIYDSYDFFRRFADPGFEYVVTSVKTMGRAVLRLANADRLPFEFAALEDSVSVYLNELKTYVINTRDGMAHHNQLVDKGYYVAAADPTQTYVPPKPKSEVPYINFAPLDNVMVNLEKSAARYSEAVKKFDQSGVSLSTEKYKALNKILMSSEQFLTHKEGLPQRPWFRHMLYAPGSNTGYGVKTLPGVREPMEAEEWALAEQQIEVLAAVLADFCSHIDKASMILEKH